MNELSKISNFAASAEFSSILNRFNRFCPFEAMGVTKAEIRHANFLAYLLKPAKPHGLGDEALVAFLSSIWPVDPEAVRRIVRRNSRIEVQREWKRIDLLILLPDTKHVVAVEMKLEAFQGDDQLSRYRRSVESQWPTSEGWNHDLVFLTVRGEEPRDDWLGLTFRNVVAAIEPLVDLHPDADAAQSMREYIAMMRRHHLIDKAAKELAEKLWAEHGDALDLLMEHRPNPARVVFDAVKSGAGAMAARLSDDGFTLVREEDTDSIVRFAVEEWDGIPGFLDCVGWTTSKRLVLVEIKSDLSAYVFMGPSNSESKRRFLEGLVQHGVLKKLPPENRKYKQLVSVPLISVPRSTDLDTEQSLEEIEKAFGIFLKAQVPRIAEALLSA
ncbi:PD-(D/E)XK nuclease family protein [Rhizobium rhizogenes]